MNNRIIVNATALKASGALSILKQFVEAIPPDDFRYVVFINDTVAIESPNGNIEFISKNLRSFISRFYWDGFGINHWLQKNNIHPLATISLQNTNIRTTKEIPNFVYYHQAIPFFRHRWNPFKSTERLLWFYKNVYWFFIKFFLNKNTEIFVQTNFIKDGFSKYFNFPASKIHIVKPRIEFPVIENEREIVLDRTQLNLFYPAVPFIYKNHSVIIEAIRLLDPEKQRKISLYFTCTESELVPLLKDVKIKSELNFIGTISFNEVLRLYQEVDALLFPSYMEAIGLPLAEAAATGLPVVAADLPYSREVLEGYSGVVYAPYDDPRSWSEHINNLFSKKGYRFDPFRLDQTDSWEKLFLILKDKI